MHQAQQDLLVLAAQNGNHKAFNLLVNRYHQSLVGFAFRLCNNRELANDAVQDSWVKLTSRLRQLKDPRAFRSWIYRLVRWRTVDLLRQHQKAKQRFDEFVEAVDETKIDGERQGSSELSRAINRLAPLEKQVIHLFYRNELKLSEIAVVLEIPVGTVKSRLNRAKKLLKQKFHI